MAQSIIQQILNNWGALRFIVLKLMEVEGERVIKSTISEVANEKPVLKDLRFLK